MYSIYKITNIANNKIYIGQTIKLIENRFKDHIRASKQISPKYKLHRSIKKYGEELFQIEIIQKCENKTEANDLEKYYIHLLHTRDDNIGYNISPGGDGGDIKTETQKLELSEKMKVDNPMFTIKSNADLFTQWKSSVSKEQNSDNKTHYNLLCNRYKTK